MPLGDGHHPAQVVDGPLLLYGGQGFVQLQSHAACSIEAGKIRYKGVLC